VIGGAGVPAVSDAKEVERHGKTNALRPLLACKLPRGMA
jgi:hypothetical protein